MPSQPIRVLDFYQTFHNRVQNFHPISQFSFFTQRRLCTQRKKTLARNEISDNRTSFMGLNCGQRFSFRPSVVLGSFSIKANGFQYAETQ